MGIVLVVLVALVLIAVGLIAYGVGIYNQLVGIKVNVEKAWANIAVLEKQRFDEIPKLVQVCEGYMAYEKGTLEKVTAARTQFMAATSPGAMAQAGAELAGALKTLFAVSENYPELKANVNFKQLQERVSALESQIADRREFYNDSVAVFNARIRQIPDLFIANLLAYTAQEMYRVPDAETVAPAIKFDIPR
jgi:LemA protein